jgi:predicted SAM-dependent methyltransferase
MSHSNPIATGTGIYPYEKTYFDMISMSHVLEHVDDDVSLLKELFFLLEKGGYVLINVPVNEVWQDPKHVRKYTAESLKDLMESVGFKIVSIDHKNRLSAFLLLNERVKKNNLFKKLLFRSFRFFMALMPLSFLESLDSIISNKYELQHLIVLAQKNG